MLHGIDFIAVVSAHGSEAGVAAVFSAEETDGGGITLPPANVSFYLEGPLKDFKAIAGQFYFDNTSDSLYIHEDMLFIHKISTFEKNEYNKKYWKIPSFTWTPSVSQVEGNQMYCLIVQGIWEKEGIPRMTIRNYVYMKAN